MGFFAGINLEAVAEAAVVVAVELSGARLPLSLPGVLGKDFWSLFGDEEDCPRDFPAFSRLHWKENQLGCAFCVEPHVSVPTFFYFSN